MEPRIQYATTSDGVSIAWWSLGQGLTIVNPPPAMPWSHIEVEWQIPEWRHWYEHLVEHARVIRYDNRGSGLSERDVTDVSLDSLVRDMEAVVDRAGIERFALFGCFQSGAISIAYAARHPERVSHLILWCSFASTADSSRAPEVTATLDRLIDVDYELFTETIAHTSFGWESGESAHRVAQYMRAAQTPEMTRRYWNAYHDIDVGELLPRIKAPTLVIHRRDFPMLGVDVARRLAAGIPDARLKILDGKSLSPYSGDFRPALDTIMDFLGVDPAAARRQPHGHTNVGPEPAPAAGFRTIMFTDMDGSTALTQRLGDDAAQELVRLHNNVVADALATHGGSQVKHTGDGIMASFPAASSAVECALAIQRAFARHNAEHPRDVVSVRIGINAGEPVVEGNDLFGTAVQLAARVCAEAQPGEVLASDVVRQLVAGKSFLFAERGFADLRGFDEPVRLFEVLWREDA